MYSNANRTHGSSVHCCCTLGLNPMCTCCCFWTAERITVNVYCTLYSVDYPWLKLWASKCRPVNCKTSMFFPLTLLLPAVFTAAAHWGWTHVFPVLLLNCRTNYKLLSMCTVHFTVLTTAGSKCRPVKPQNFNVLPFDIVATTYLLLEWSCNW